MTRQEMIQQLRQEFDLASEKVKDTVLSSTGGWAWTPRMLITEVEAGSDIGMRFVDTMIKLQESKNKMN